MAGDLGRYYQACVCGEKLKSDVESETLSQSGLSRFFAITGLQIYCLELMAGWFIHRRSRVASAGFTTLLGGYVVMTGLGAASVRAFLQYIVDCTSLDEKWGWPRVRLAVIGGALSVVLFSQFATSKGFLFGWIAVTWARHFQRSKYLAFYLFLLLTPIFLNFPGAITPTGILSRMIQPVFLGLLLLPSFSVAVFPVLHHLVDPLWRLFLEISSHPNWVSEVGPNANADGFFNSLAFLWIYLIACILITTALSRRQRLKYIWPQGVPCGIS